MSWHASVRSVAVAISAFLAGCSAIQIDVDVYKGPLANEHDIQVQQFAALAIAARPLLASLRTDIEDQLRTVNHKPNVKTEVPDSRLREGYLGDDVLAFQSRLARFVNGALSAYEDQGAGPEAELAAQYSQLAALLTRLQVSTADRTFAMRIRVPAAGVRRTFALKYRAFLCGDTDPDVASAAKVCDLAEPTPRNAPTMLYTKSDRDRTPRPCPVGDERECTVEPRSNEGFALLRDEVRVAKHSIQLFGERDTDFVDRVVELGSAYDQARLLVRQILQTSLQILEQAAADRDQRKISAAAKAVSIALQPSFVACYLASPQASDLWASPAGKNLSERLLSGPIKLRSEDNADLAKKIGDAASDPAMAREMAILLRAIDRRIAPPDRQPQPFANSQICGGDARFDAQYLPNLVVPQARWYGLARGVSSGLDFDVIRRELGASVAALGSNAAGFEHARLPKGLDRLTREYREITLRDGGQRDDFARARSLEALEESLLFFSERVLFVINTLSNPVLEDELQGVEANEIAKLSARLATLQTLGNSLVLHANDLHRRRAHAKDQERTGPMERRAAQSAFSPGADIAYDAFVLSAEQALKRLGRTKTVQTAGATRLDGVVTALEQQLADDERAHATADDTNTKASAAKAGIEAALRTLAPVAGRPAGLGGPTDANVMAQERRDQGQVKVFVANQKPGAIEPLVLLESLATELDRMAGDATSTQAERIRLAAEVARKQRDALSWPTAAKPLPAKQTVAAIVQELGAMYGRRAGEASAAVLAEKRTQEAVNTSKKRLAEAKQERTAALSVAQKAGTGIDTVETVRTELEAARAAVIGKAVEHGVRDAAALQRLLVDHLKAASAATPPPSEDRKKALAETMQFLSGFTPPTRITIAGGTAGVHGSTPRDVLDEVIAALRHQRIEALAAGQDDRATNLAKAIDAAYEARQSSTFLRPAADYLKSVYSSTALAEGPQSNYRNLLVDYLKNLRPDDTDGLSAFEQRARDAKEQTEKLFWQNINRVTVAGGGATNTVLAKDDVGNWYVKSYSADPEAVIQSAKSLALFRVGKRVDLNLLRRADLQRKADDTTLGDTERNRAQAALDKTGPDVNVGLLRVQDRLRSNYDRDTAASVDALRSALVSLPGALKAAAAENVDMKDVSADFEGLVRAAGDKHLVGMQGQLQDAHDLPASDTQRVNKMQNAFVEGLKALRRFAREVAAGAETLKTGATANTPKAASALVRTEANNRIEAAAKRQKAVLDTFEAGLQIVGEARTAN